jgi:hypothetical protein
MNVLESLHALGARGFTLIDNPKNELEFNTYFVKLPNYQGPKISWEEIQAKIAELEAAEPMRLLRIERNRILQQSDWRDLPSYPGTDQEAWRTYRQALRDITETQTPELDEFGNLTNITWPEEPT